jgi:IS1 family transposase
MNRLSTEQRARVVACLVEGMSVRSTVRVTGVAKNTVAKLLRDLGEACSDFADAALRGLRPQRVQADEIWSFVYCKARMVSKAKAAPDGAGDAWTWVALDADTKLALTWMVGPRTAGMAEQFMLDLAGRVVTRCQITTDGFKPYPWAVANAFGPQNVDYGIVEKAFASPLGSDGRYSPPVCVGAKRRRRFGSPDMEHVSTSYAERGNLTMRMGMRRFTRLTNGFSKKAENLAAAVSIHFVHYNWCRKHQSLKGQTPAQAAGIADHQWGLEKLVALLERSECAAS